MKNKFLNKYLGIMIFLLAIGAICFYVGKNIDYNWQWYRVGKYLFSINDGRFTKGLLIDGLFVTIKISLISLFFTFIIGFTTALLRFTSSPVLNYLVIFYVETIRNTPLLIQIFVIYFVVSPVIDLSPFASSVVALSLFEGAYASEIVRSGINSIPHEQWEASWSLGLSSMDNYRYVIFPQAMRQILPILAGLGVSLIKDSALVSTISIYDLTMRGQSIVADTFLTFEIWFTVAFCYFILTISLSMWISFLEKRISLKYRH